MAIATILCTPLFTKAQNVGIGTVTPSARLHIEVPSGFTSPVLQVDEAGSITPYLIVQSDGKVGIGVANPSSKLHIEIPSGYPSPGFLVNKQSVPYPYFVIDSNGAVGISVMAVHPSAILQIGGTTKGVILPRLTQTQRTSIASPDTGLLVYQKTTPQDGFWFFDGVQWRYMLTDKDMLWKHSGDSLFSLPDTAVVIRGVGMPMSSNPAQRTIYFNSREPGYYIQFHPRDGNVNYPAQGMEFRGSNDSTAQYIDFAPNGGDFDGRIIYNPRYGGVWAAPKGFWIRSKGGIGIVIDSLTRVGISYPVRSESWDSIGGNKPDLWVGGRIVGWAPSYPADGSELPYLPYHNPCVINLHDTTVDIGDTLRFWLARCKTVRLNLDSGKVYKWNTPVTVRDFQVLLVIAPKSSTGYTAFKDTAVTTVIIDKVDTVTFGGNDYYNPRKILVGNFARFQSDRVFYKFIKNTTLPPSIHCNHQGIIVTSYGSQFNTVFIHQGKYEGEEISFIKISADAWSRIVLADFVVRNTGSTVIYPVRVTGGCHGTANGAIVGRVGVILGPNVQWETNPRIIYNQ